MAIMNVKALTFDVFGTVVDWRSSLIREGEALGKAKRLSVDWAKFADAWRGLYQPAMDEVRSGRRPWTKLDDLHRESLDKLLAQFGIKGFTEAEIDHLNRAWHRLDPWPDSVPGLTRLKRKFVLATLSNGNVALIVNMAKYGGLPWDAVLGAEVARHYKSPPTTATSATPARSACARRSCRGRTSTARARTATSPRRASGTSSRRTSRTWRRSWAAERSSPWRRSRSRSISRRAAGWPC